MGKCNSGEEMNVTMYDNKGVAAERFKTPKALWTTTKGDGTSGSKEWLKQVYVAPDKQGLNDLLSTEKLQPELADGTSGCSSNVTFLRKKGDEVETLKNQHVICEGEPIPDNQGFSWATHLHVSPVPIEPGHPLHELWKKNID